MNLSEKHLCFYIANDNLLIFILRQTSCIANMAVFTRELGFKARYDLLYFLRYAIIHYQLKDLVGGGFCCCF